MANSKFTSTGLDAVKAAVPTLPSVVNVALRQVAVAIGTRMQASAQTRLLAQTKAQKTDAAITMTIDDAKRQVRVSSPPVSGDPANNPIWIEHGTVREPAKPYMLPALKECEADATTLSAAAATTAVASALGT